MELQEYKKLLENKDIQKYLELTESKCFLDRYLYFIDKIGKDCKYADACIKMMAKDIDEFNRGR